MVVQVDNPINANAVSELKIFFFLNMMVGVVAISRKLPIHNMLCNFILIRFCSTLQGEKTFEGGVSLLASAGGIILSMLTELVVQDVSLLLIE